MSSTAETLQEQYERLGTDADSTAGPRPSLELMLGEMSGEARIGPEELRALITRWNIRARSRNDETIRRLRNLRVVLGRLENMRFADAALLLGTSDKRLAAWLHEQASMPVQKRQRVHEMAQLLASLEKVLDRASFGEWFATPVPALGGLTPLQAIERKKVHMVSEVIQSYLDTSFG